jgi:hypothetical protein
MEPETELRISNAAQVRACALERLRQEQAAAEGETVTLPSGLIFMMRRPRPLWWALQGRLPSSLAARVASSEPPLAGARGSEDTVALAQWITALLEETVVSPKVRLNPGAGEADPNWLSEEDVLFIMRYAGGEAMADGQSLDRFPPGGGEPAAAGAGGADVELPAVADAGAGPAERSHDGLAD